MSKKEPPKIITTELIRRYAAYLREQEKSAATVQKYVHDLTTLREYLAGELLTKTALIGWKEHLTEQYAPASVNTILVALNGFLNYYGWRSLKKYFPTICAICSPAPTTHWKKASHGWLIFWDTPTSIPPGFTR